MLCHYEFSIKQCPQHVQIPPHRKEQNVVELAELLHRRMSHDKFTDENVTNVFLTNWTEMDY